MKRKKILQALTTALVIGIFSVSSLAASMGNGGVVETSDTVLNIPKSILVVNSDYNQSYSPDITYTFTVTPSANLSRVTDSNGTSVAVQAGVANGVSTSASVDFDPSLVTSTGTSLSEEVTANLVLSVDLTKFEQPGIYRYTITDTTSIEALYNAGIVRASDYDTTRELDVYITRNATTGTLGVDGYVLLDEIPGTVVESTLKSPGYVENGDIVKIVNPGEDGTPGTADDVITYEVADPSVSVDRYITYNLEVTKTVTGSMGDTSNEFPFAITLADAGTVFAGGDTTALEASTATEFATALHSGETYYIYGCSPLASYMVAETNNTSNPYVVTSNVGDITNVSVDPNGTISTGGANDTLIDISNYETVNSDTNVSTEATGNGTVGFINNLEAPTPTGFLMRVLPYTLILGLIAGAFVLFKKFHIKSEEQ